MVRNYVRKSSQPRPSEETLQLAVAEVMEKRMSLRAAAQYFGLARSTLADYVRKVRVNGDIVPNQLKRCQHIRQIFTAGLESELADYLKKCSLMNHGLTPLETRKLAYSFAAANNVQVPFNRKITEAASRDWFSGFLKRNPTLAIRAPEQTSQGRASGFNKPVVAKFFDNLMTVMLLYNFPAFRIWNTDETGIPTVMPPPKVVATKGLKQVQQTVSHERGVNVTMLAFISAAGTHIPPVYIFPRKKFLTSMTRAGPTGCVGFAHPSGWINGDTFLDSLKHFAACTGCSKEVPHLLLLDNHSSHLDLNVINFARDNGIVMLTFPPHCSNKLQPLDVSVFGPFKSAPRTSFNDWQNLNPGGWISIHQIAELSRKPYERSFNTSNIISGFSKSGIFPFDRDTFSDADFLPSFATDRLEVSAAATPATSTVILATVHQPSSTVVAPCAIKPFPQINQDRQTTGRKRNAGRTRILTSTTEKNSLEQDHLSKRRKVPAPAIPRKNNKENKENFEPGAEATEDFSSSISSSPVEQ